MYVILYLVYINHNNIFYNGGYTMIYTEEDLKQAYDMGYNEAVDDVNAYIDQESMEFTLDESYDEDYSAVEDMICNETKMEKERA